MELNAQTLLDAGAALGTVSQVDTESTPFVVIPKDYKVTDLEFTLENPARKRGTVITTDTESFCHYVNKHAENGHTVIYASIDSEKSQFGLTAVINDHAADCADWRDHRCNFEPKQSVEWQCWLTKNKEQFSQIQFAAFLEENLPDIASGIDGMPTGSDMLQMALGFEANAERRLNSKVNLQDGGISLEFVDQANEKTRQIMKFFHRFMIGIPVFEGAASAYPIEARLKYREKEGRLTFWYELIRPDRVFKTAVDEELTRIKDATKMPVISGTP